MTNNDFQGRRRPSATFAKPMHHRQRAKPLPYSVAIESFPSRFLCFLGPWWDRSTGRAIIGGCWRQAGGLTRHFCPFYGHRLPSYVTVMVSVVVGIAVAAGVFAKTLLIEEVIHASYHGRCWNPAQNAWCMSWVTVAWRNFDCPRCWPPGSYFVLNIAKLILDPNER